MKTGVVLPVWTGSEMKKNMVLLVIMIMNLGELYGANNLKYFSPTTNQW